MFRSLTNGSHPFRRGLEQLHSIHEGATLGALRFKSRNKRLHDIGSVRREASKKPDDCLTQSPQIHDRNRIPMKEDLFLRLVTSLKEGGAILRGGGQAHPHQRPSLALFN
jgi:hypothetical protein